jgi:hypothetical protein
MASSTINLVSQTIYEQLGGGRFKVMTGAKDFVHNRNSLSFRIPQSNRGINRVSVTLNPRDTYDLMFSRMAGGFLREVEALQDIHVEDLQRLFTNVTGLATRL